MLETVQGKKEDFEINKGRFMELDALLQEIRLEEQSKETSDPLTPEDLETNY